MLGGRPVRLLLEGVHRADVRVPGQRLAALQVAVAGVRGGRDDAEGDEDVGRLLRDGEPLLQRGLERLDGVHDLVGRHHGDDRLGVAGGEHRRGPGDRVEGVATLGLAEDVLRRHLGQVGRDGVRVVPAGAHEDVRGGHQALDALVRQPQQALAADDLEQLLRHVLPGERPEPFAGTAGDDQHVPHGQQARGNAGAGAKARRTLRRARGLGTLRWCRRSPSSSPAASGPTAAPR